MIGAVIGFAIERSIHRGTVETLDFSDFARPRGDSLSDARTELRCECSDYAEGDGLEKFWGVDLDGREWRVHVRYACPEEDSTP